MTYPNGYELYKRVDVPSGGEKYVILSTFTEKPSSDDINDAFLGKPRYVDYMDRILDYMDRILYHLLFHSTDSRVLLCTCRNREKKASGFW